MIGEVFCWTRNPMEVRRLATRKLQIFRDNVARSVEEVRVRGPPQPRVTPVVEPLQAVTRLVRFGWWRH